MLKKAMYAATILSPIVTLLGLLQGSHSVSIIIFGICANAWFVWNAWDVLHGKPMVFYGNLLGPEKVAARKFVMIFTTVTYFFSIWILFRN